MKQLMGTLLDNQRLNREMFLMTIGLPESELAAFEPGQFVHVATPGEDQVLRRPISIYDVTDSALLLAVQIKGEGTRRLSALAPGAPVDLLAPLGHGFILPEGAKRIFLVGGGVGCAPLLYTAKRFSSASACAFLGYRSREVAYGLEAFQALCETCVVSDDGSIGRKGLVTEPLMERLAAGDTPDMIYACGPAPMLRALKAQLPERVPCQVSLEERMGCGVGGCLVCVCKTQKGYKRVCQDGPVFDIREVDFDG